MAQHAYVIKYVPSVNLDEGVWSDGLCGVKTYVNSFSFLWKKNLHRHLLCTCYALVMHLKKVSVRSFLNSFAQNDIKQKKRLYRIVNCILDYCNSLLTGWANSLTSLQLVPNVPCRPLTEIRMSLHFSYPHLFYRLPFKSNRVFKLLLLVHRGQGPSYLEKLVLDIKHPLLSSLLSLLAWPSTGVSSHMSMVLL